MISEREAEYIERIAHLLAYDFKSATLYAKEQFRNHARGILHGTSEVARKGYQKDLKWKVKDVVDEYWKKKICPNTD